MSPGARRGLSLPQQIQRLREEQRRRVAAAQRAILDEWPRLLRSRAHRGAPPPEHMIISRQRGGGKIEIGWLDYPSGPELAARRWSEYPPLIGEMAGRLLAQHLRGG